MRRLGRDALAVAVLVLGALAYTRFGRVPSPEELRRLRDERRALSERLERSLSAQVDLPAAPDASVVVGVPARFAERFARDVAKSLLSEVRLTLRGLELRKSGEVHGKILVGRSRLGTFDLEVRLDEVSGLLRAGMPRLRFEGQRVGVLLPVSVAGGSGRGRLRFRWDGRGVAGAVCGDVELEGRVAGKVAPATYTLRGGFRFAADGSALVARPELDDVEIHLRVEPSEETWRLVDEAVEKQGAVCRAALRAADVAEKVREVVGRGFKVDLPRDLLPEIRLPVEVEDAVAMEGALIRFRVRPTGLKLTRERLWYGADVQLVADDPAMAAAPASGPPPPSPSAEPVEAVPAGDPVTDPEASLDPAPSAPGGSMLPRS